MTKVITASHILVEHEFEGQDLLKKISNGEKFEDLAKSYSNCPSGKDGGHLGEFGKGMMVKEFEQVAFSLNIGEVSGPVKTQFGVHLILRTA